MKPIHGVRDAYCSWIRVTRTDAALTFTCRRRRSRKSYDEPCTRADSYVCPLYYDASKPGDTQL